MSSINMSTSSQVHLTIMKSARDMANPKRGECPKSSAKGVCPSGKTLKGVCPSMTTRKDQEIDQAVGKYAKDLINSRMGVMPQCDDP